MLGTHHPLLWIGICVLAIASVSADNYGYFFYPRYVVPGSTYPITVDLGNFFEVKSGIFDVTATFRLQEPWPGGIRNITSVTKKFSEDNPRDDIIFQIPSDVDRSSYPRFLLDVSLNGVSFGESQIYSYFYNQGVPDSKVLIQTDKGLYKAGQTVQFRVMIVDNARRIGVKPMTIEIFDGDGNRMRRWVNVSDNSGVFAGKMEMSQYPVLGTWSIRVKQEDTVASETFKVQEFQLPKFSVSIEIPEVISLNDDIFEGTIESLYTFGKGVTGVVNLVLTYGRNAISKSYKLVDGIADIKIPMSDMKELLKVQSRTDWSTISSFISTTSTNSNPSSSVYQQNRRYYIDARATVTEDLTGNTANDTLKVLLADYDASLKMDSSTASFVSPGQPLTIAGTVTGVTGSAYQGLASDDFYVTLSVSTRSVSWPYITTEIVNKQNLTIDDRNRFSYTLDGTLITQRIRYYAYIDLIVKSTNRIIDKESQYFSPLTATGNKTISIEQTSGSRMMNIGETASFKIHLEGPGSVTATYRILSNGVVVRKGSWISLSEHNPHNFDVLVTEETIPAFVIVAWFILPYGSAGNAGSSSYLGATGLQVSVKARPKQATSIEFETEMAKPNDEVQLILKDSPRSAFYILAVDKSMLLLDKGNDITEALFDDATTQARPFVLSAYPSTNLYSAGLSIRYVRLRDPMSPSQSTSTHYYYHDHWSSVSSASSAVAFETSASTLRSMAASTVASLSSRRGLTTTTPTSVEKSEPKPEPKQNTIRKKFPDTWLFENVTADSTGTARITRKVPDTVTTWVANCFAVNSQSVISVAQNKAELKVFLPFFISLQLPTSVIRNEQVVLQANVFNYHTEDLYVMVTLRKSSQFRGLAVVKRGKRKVLEERCGNIVLCIFAKAGRGTAAFFPIIPTALGKIKITITADSSLFKDTVIKYLRVESEGAPKDVAYPMFIDLTSEKTYESKLDLNYPPNTVEGSQRMRMSVIGDIMGSSIEGLERLVIHPYGCGEQNMLSTAPSVFVLKYLTAVGKLTEGIKEKAENFIMIGMQRQLRYKHGDWSFSAWGGSGSGSTWIFRPFHLPLTHREVGSYLKRTGLTSFVLKVFAMATNYVDIDDQIVVRTSSWLISTQNADGSFPEKGNVNNRNLQGASKGTAERITAYVLIALIEGKKASTNVEFCSGCLEKLDKAIERATAFLSNSLLNQTSVYTVAISTYALTLAKHSSAENAIQLLDSLSNSGPGMKFWKNPNPPPVSKFHYGPSTTAISIEMTAYALLAFVEAGDTTTSLLINKWMIQQRNSYGGFISTQDTVIGLQGMAEIGGVMKSSEDDMVIVVSYFDTRHRKKTFKINKSNSMIMQLEDISSDTSRVAVHAWTSGSSAAILTVSLFYNIFMDLEARSLTLDVTVLEETINGFTVKACVSWLEDETSGMVVAEIGIPSGFVANQWTISSHNLLKRVEIEERKVVLYFDEVTFKKICIHIPFIRDKMVANVKAVPCKAYEYYEPSNEVTVFYVPLSAKNSNVCSICGIECGCTDSKEKLWFPKSWCKKKV